MFSTSHPTPYPPLTSLCVTSAPCSLYTRPHTPTHTHTHTLHRHSTPLPYTAHAPHTPPRPTAPHDCHIVITLPTTHVPISGNASGPHHTPISHVPQHLLPPLSCHHTPYKPLMPPLHPHHSPSSDLRNPTPDFVPLYHHRSLSLRHTPPTTTLYHTRHISDIHTYTALPHNHPACLLRHRSHHAAYLSIHTSTCSAARLQSIPTPPRPSHNNTKHQRRHQTPITTPNTNDNNKHQQPPTHHHNHQPNITSPHSRE